MTSPYSHPDPPPQPEPVPLYVSHQASYALSRREEDRSPIRDAIPEQWRAAFDAAMHVQQEKGEAQHSTSVRERMRIELEVREARRLADAHETQNSRKPIRSPLVDELLLPDEDQLYAIDRLLPVGGNAVFAGRYKAGKTTFNANLLRAWADDVPFLGHFRCHPPEDRPVVTIFNYEMTREQFRRWMRRFNIQNTHNVYGVHLRGTSLPLALPEVRREVAGWLRDAGTGLWVVDPASRAMVGMDGDKNAEVNVFTSWLDEIKNEAGVRDLVMNVHMPHNAKENEAERALGAQAWSAWGDALWMLTMDKDNCRWFHALGRDVEEEKMLVNYNAENMDVSLIDTDPATMKRDSIETAVLKVVAQNPGINKRGLRDHARTFVNVRLTDIDQTVDQLVRENKILTSPGPNKQVFHDLAKGVETLDDQ